MNDLLKRILLSFVFSFFFIFCIIVFNISFIISFNNIIVLSIITLILNFVFCVVFLSSLEKIWKGYDEKRKQLKKNIKQKLINLDVPEKYQPYEDIIKP